ncbi:Ubiquitin domain-containing protein 2 [Sciurus carolinensis]|uniref:Ubiquitin domain-containing protein 2 n=1 Tax=Sciurus carolinensis TaxID=30640 RepID=A0AA41TC93_SCICA|nr:Ubiquitin domain-containing protein 2 [Sciurus carolinensis]
MSCKDKEGSEGVSATDMLSTWIANKTEGVALQEVSGGSSQTDKMKLEELKIPKVYMMQVILSQPVHTPMPV